MALPSISSRERIYTTLSAGSNSSGDNTEDITISSVDTSRTMIITQCRPPSNARRGFAAFELVNSTTLRAHRWDERSSIEVEIQVIEWDSSVTVQHDYTYDTTAADTISFTLSAVDTSKTMVLFSAVGGGNNTYGKDNFYRPDLTSTTNLDIIRDSSGNGNTLVAIQAIEFDEATVQWVDVAFDAADTSVDTTITSVDTASTFVLSSCSANNNFDPNEMFKSSLTSATNLRIERSAAGSSIDFQITAQVIECSAFTTQEVEYEYTVSDSMEVTQTITSVDTSRSFCLSDIQCHGGQGGPGFIDTVSSGTVGNWRSAFMLTDFRSSTELDFYRAQDNIDCTHRAYVVQVDAASGGTTYEVALAEGVAIADNVTVTIDIETVLAESAAFADTITTTMVMEAGVTESMSASDTDVAGLALLDAIAESVTISDLLSALISYNHAVAEGIIATDSVSALADLIAEAIESLAISDTAEAQLVFEAAISESLSIGDTMTAELLGQIEAAIAEGASISDVIAAHLDMIVGVSESFTISDVMTATIAAAAYEVALAESASIADSVSAQMVFEAFIAESITISDTITAQAVFEAAIAEAATINDAMSLPSLGRYLIATISIYAALSASSSKIIPGLDASSVKIKPD